METRSQAIFAPLSLTVLLFLRYSSAACFFPNGTDRNSDGEAFAGEYLPCDNVANVSMCCAIGRMTEPDTCLPGGLCKNEGAGKYWRESCTDKTWQSSSCVKLFVKGPGSLQDVPIWPCDDGSWCLESRSGAGRQCCREGGGYFIVDGNATRANSNAMATATSSVTAPAVASPSDVPSSSTSTRTKVGIGVGVGLGVIGVILLVGVFFLLRRRRRRQESGRPDVHQGSVGPAGTTAHSMGDYRTEYSELESPQSTQGKGTKSYVPYRRSGLEHSPAELSSEGKSANHENPGPP